MSRTTIASAPPSLPLNNRGSIFVLALLCCCATLFSDAFAPRVHPISPFAATASQSTKRIFFSASNGMVMVQNRGSSSAVAAAAPRSGSSITQRYSSSAARRGQRGNFMSASNDDNAAAFQSNKSQSPVSCNAIPPQPSTAAAPQSVGAALTVVKVGDAESSARTATSSGGPSSAGWPGESSTSLRASAVTSTWDQLPIGGESFEGSADQASSDSLNILSEMQRSSSSDALHHDEIESGLQSLAAAIAPPYSPAAADQFQMRSRSMSMESTSAVSYNPSSLTNLPASVVPSSISTVDSLQNVVKSFLTSMEQPSLQFGRTLVLLASAIYGTNFATVKMLDAAMPLEISAALRFGLAASVVGAIVLGGEALVAQGKEVPPEIAQERQAGLMAGLEIGFWYFLGYTCQSEGLQTVAAGKSAFFNSLAVVVVPLLDAAIKNKLLKKQDVIAIGLASLGVGLLELGPTGISVSLGDLFAFGQTIFFGIGYWRLEDVSQKHPTQPGRITVGQLGGVAAGSVLFAIVEAQIKQGVPIPIDQWMAWFSDPFIVASLMWTGLISTAMALYLETVALKVVSATELTLIMTSVSLWGAAFAYVTMGEMLSTTGMVGGLLILTGCVMGNITPKVKKGDEYTADVIDDDNANGVLEMGQQHI
mmetsp:Transcript_4310/g.12322  ORF Transcript_4310/g.12322 Transcript_4310/m.12322 type:complete len:650 (+) Transcript_4310:362-2311(+)|eukprot:CAMPEP_0119567536 /NCGR_PEP_ID=MMETSP1352-20130426/36177_1 /TAXON_ID=265584 /ORGANISM="Stauroneis constricta, Strain CCMP1120" /LENGTH=649 /DNA_ID=CAMNT_0007616803 /DNA_START=352 /DNA_END=2301 /DNA_ORIENTATION=+